MLQVTCAILVHDQKILICQRAENMSLPLKWEFPGGKLEKGESEESCLIPFISTATNPILQLTEHKAYAWVMPQALLQYDLAPADIPIVHEILKLWN